MSEWQPIETAPNSTLILAWMNGLHEHSGTTWARYGHALIVLHDGVISQDTRKAAMDRLIGPEYMHPYATLAPTHWMPLPEPPK